MASIDVIREIFFDSDSEDEFLGFSGEEARLASVRRQQALPRAGGDNNFDDLDDDTSDSSEDEAASNFDPVRSYDHEWLRSFVEPCGPMNMPGELDEVELFSKFFNDAVIELMVTETNRYADQAKAKQGENATAHSRISQWKPTTVEEIKAFIALILVIGLTERSSFTLYWTTDPLLEIPGFRKVMSRDRFLSILTFLHLCNNEEALPRDNPAFDKIFKVRPLVELLVPLWQYYFKPSKEISVDESMIAFKGRTELMQYMPQKPSKWGMKGWGLADSKSGYMYNWSFYTGRDNTRTEHGLAHRVVTDLARVVYGKGHVIYMDNFFSSPALFNELADNQLGACGTFRINRQGIPATIKQTKLKAGDPTVTARVDNTLFLSWFDKRQVNVMTNVHSSETFHKTVRSKHHPDNVRHVEKPVAIESYSRNMGGVDRADKGLSHYLFSHRSMKWWKKVFFYLLELSFCNSLIIWRQLRGVRVNAEKYRLAIAHGLLQGYEPSTSSRPGRRSQNPPPERLIGGSHYLTLCKQAGGKHSYPDCEVCSDRKHKRHQTHYKCRQCAVPLCPYPCFERYHTMVDYKLICNPNLHKE